ncbi:hypothetical protein PUN28_003770 [Cardiocondyla obscurior]|uniref:Uncharacterized protein n=1 Tax=Cardiocondyla obscurior TaxID=286306 RepID=A0AAW2GK76_9HYME
MERIEEEINMIDVEELLSSNDTIDKIQFFDSTVEIIGYVDEIESPKIVGNNQQYKIFKFFFNNGKGRKIQVLAWNDDIDIVMKHIQPNNYGTSCIYCYAAPRILNRRLSASVRPRRALTLSHSRNTHTE